MDISRLPKKLTVMGVPFRVVYKDRLKDSEGTEVYGLTHGHNRLIEVNPALHENEEHLRSTLLHEALHAILHVSGISQGLKDHQEEGLVIALENALGPIIMQLGKYRG